MTKKLIMFDIDGTLLDHEKKLPSSAKEAISHLKEAGHEVAISTGRAPYLFEGLRKELEIDSYVSFNGQYVVIHNEVIYTNPIKKEYLAHLSAYAASHHHPLVYMGADRMKASIAYHAEIEEAIATLHSPHPEEDAAYYQHADVFQALLFCKDHEESIYRDHIRDLNFIRWHPYSMDVLPLGGSKAKGIEKFLEKKGFAKEDVFAFGDNFNDIEMLQYVGNGIAMGNAPEEVKKYAKYVTKDVDEDGIAYGLEMVGLLK